MPKYKWNKETQNMEIVPGTHNYRSKWACFGCRKSFTRTLESIEPRAVHCPDCGKESTDMGYLFQPPPKRNIESWKIVKLIRKNGFNHTKAGNVFCIKYKITNNKASLAQVRRNIESILNHNKKRL